jgi:protein-tyrosine phosphatase
MNWILKNVAVGSYPDDIAPEFLKRKDVSAILNIRDKIWKDENQREAEYFHSEEIVYYHIPVKDFTIASDDEFARGIAFIGANIKLNKKHTRVLVHCDGGLGRSPSFAAVYLLYSGKCPNAEIAIAQIQNKREGCFTGGDAIHLPRIREFEKRLPEMRAQIESMMESFLSNLRIGVNP